MAKGKIRRLGPKTSGVYVHDFKAALVRNEFVCTGIKCWYWQKRGWCQRAKGPVQLGCACVPMLREQRDWAVLRARRRTWEERCRDQLAFAHFYMDWLFSDVGWDETGQPQRVRRLSKRYIDLRAERSADFSRRRRIRGEDAEMPEREYGRFAAEWERRFAALFQEIEDETENMC